MDNRRLEDNYCHTRMAWCAAHPQIRGSDVLWMRLGRRTAFPCWINGRPESGRGLSRGETPVQHQQEVQRNQSQQELWHEQQEEPVSGLVASPVFSENRWLCATRDWLLVSRQPFRGRYFEAKIPLSAMQIVCTPSRSKTHKRGIVLIASTVWWAKAAPPPRSRSDSTTFTTIAATVGGAAGAARSASVASRAFKATGLRGTRSSGVSVAWNSWEVSESIVRKDRRRLLRRVGQGGSGVRAFLIECDSLEERNWIIYCLQATATSPQSLGFLRTIEALAEAELVLHKVAVFLMSRGCLELGTAVDPQFAGLALGICGKGCCGCSKCKSATKRSPRACSVIEESSAEECCSSSKVLGCLPYRSLVGSGARAAAEAAAAGGFWVPSDLLSCLLHQPQHAKLSLLLLLEGQAIKYPFTKAVRGQLKQRGMKLKALRQCIKKKEQQLLQQQKAALMGDSVGAAASDSTPGGPLQLLSSIGGVVLQRLQETLNTTVDETADRLRRLRDSCCCSCEKRCGCCCCCDSKAVQQQNRIYCKHGPVEIPHGIFRRYKRFLELADPLINLVTLHEEKQPQQAPLWAEEIKAASKEKATSAGVKLDEASGALSIIKAKSGLTTRPAEGPKESSRESKWEWLDISLESEANESCVLLGGPLLRKSAQRSFPPSRLPRVGSECVICLERFAPNEILTHYPGCCHPYHLRCLSAWIECHNRSSNPRAPRMLPESSAVLGQMNLLAEVASLLVAEDAACQRTLCWSSCCSRGQVPIRQLQHQQEHPRHSKDGKEKQNAGGRQSSCRKGILNRCVFCRCSASYYPEEAFLASPAPPLDSLASATATNAGSTPLLSPPAPAPTNAASVAGTCNTTPLSERITSQCLGNMQHARGARSPRAPPLGCDLTEQLLLQREGRAAAASTRVNLVERANTKQLRAAGASEATEESVTHSAAAAGGGCISWHQLLRQLLDVEYWVVTAATVPQLSDALLLLESRGLPLTDCSTQGCVGALPAFKDRCPLCQHAVLGAQ
ncbi:ring-h2 finger protein [Cyclospora cayetanensis]|uniref:Ring-h2 finger protein n=1 Tax=Cyclospora cayetanensis TaxID=88456 RepID=A0A1D3CVI4_9EIME|nr:ring-h2 finger protein [Cyclospora cayetanensis]